MGLRLPNYWNRDVPRQQKPWYAKSRPEKIQCLLDRLIVPFSQQTLETVALIVGLKTIEAHMDRYGDAPAARLELQQRFPRAPWEWGEWWRSVYGHLEPPMAGQLLPHQFYTTRYLRLTIFAAREALEYAILRDPDALRDEARTIDEIVAEEGLLPALRSLRDFARQDLGAYRFILVHVMAHVEQVHTTCEAIMCTNTVHRLPTLPRVARMDCFPFLRGPVLIDP